MESDHIMLAVFQLPWRSLLLMALTAWLAAALEALATPPLAAKATLTGTSVLLPGWLS